jgi:hypothetical protein
MDYPPQNVQQTNLLHTVGASLRTGNVLVDILVGTMIASLMGAIMSNISLIWQRFEKWWNGRVRAATAGYKHKFVIRLNELQVSGADGHHNKMGVNDENGILITGIIRNLMTTGAIDQVHEQEIKNILSDDFDQCTRDRHLKSVISNFPQSSVTWQGMRFEFENSTTVNQGEKSPSVTRSEQISVQSNDRAATVAYFEQCKLAEIDRLYPAPNVGVVKFQPYYWFISNKPAKGENYVFNRYPWSSAKTFDSLFFARKAEVIQTLDHFRNRTGPWAEIKQRTHTCNIFLWGNPGGGKTSMVKAIANYMGRHIFGLNMARVTCDEDMLDIVSNIYVEYKSKSYNHIESVPLDKRIYLLEDLDCAGCEHIIAPRDPNAPPPKRQLPTTPKPESDDEDDMAGYTVRGGRGGRGGRGRGGRGGSVVHVDMRDAVPLFATPAPPPVQGPTAKDVVDVKFNVNDTSLSGFLNMLNGINELTGAMFIISTNHKEKFDPAIYRPGRMDIDIEMGRMSSNDILGYLTRYYGDASAPEILHAAALASGMHMPSRIEQICQSHITALDAARALGDA